MGIIKTFIFYKNAHFSWYKDQKVDIYSKADREGITQGSFSIKRLNYLSSFTKYRIRRQYKVEA